MVPAESKQALEGYTLDSGITFYALEQELSVSRHEVQQLRVGMYQRYHGGNMDEEVDTVGPRTVRIPLLHVERR